MVNQPKNVFTRIMGNALSCIVMLEIKFPPNVMGMIINAPVIDLKNMMTTIKKVLKAALYTNCNESVFNSICDGAMLKLSKALRPWERGRPSHRAVRAKRIAQKMASARVAVGLITSSHLKNSQKLRQGYAAGWGEG